MQDLCRTYGLSVSYSVLSVQGLVKDVLAAPASTGGDEASSAGLKKSHDVKKADLEKSFALSKERLADAEHIIQEFKHNRDTLDDLTDMVDETETSLKGSEEQVIFLEDIVSELSIRLVEKDAVSNSYREPVSILEKDLTSELAKVKCLTTEHIVEKDLLDCVHTAFALHKTASQ